MTGSQVRDGAITGAKIRLSSVGVIPKANRANHGSVADNANLLGGRPANAFALTMQLPFTQVSPNPGYANFGNGYATASYMRDTLGFVHLHGTMYCATGISVAFTFHPASGRENSF